MTVEAKRSRRARARRGRLLVMAGIPLGMIGSAALVWQASYAAFSGKTENASNTITSGTVSLSDNDSGTAAFTLTGLRPGSSGSRCIVVTYTGSLTPSTDVQVYSATATPVSSPATNWPTAATSPLATQMLLSIQRSTTTTAVNAPAYSSNSDCTATGVNFDSPATIFGDPTQINKAGNSAHLASAFFGKTTYNVGNAASSSQSAQWIPTGGSNAIAVFKVNYRIADDADDSAQGQTVRFNVVWEARS